MSEEDFVKAQFWVHVKGLPREYHTREVVEKIGSSVSGVKQVQIRETMEDGVKFFRARMEVEVSKPIRRTIRLRGMDGEDLYGLLRYERLPLMCFKCGIIGHVFKNCKSGGPIGKLADYQYGIWLNADFEKLVLLQKIDIEGGMKRVEGTVDETNSAMAGDEPQGRMEEQRPVTGAVAQEGGGAFWRDLSSISISNSGEKEKGSGSTFGSSSKEGCRMKKDNRVIRAEMKDEAQPGDVT